MRREHGFLGDDLDPYFRDVYDHTIRVVEALESERDLLATVLDTYLTQASNRMNRVMKQLNVVATISLPLVVVGGIFVAETLSVALQVASYKLTGKRIFKMAPIHHHFEQIGWPESKVIVRFWVVGIILALMSIGSLKLR